jgi:hypothetical protein
MSARAFVTGSSLNWSHGGGCRDHQKAPLGTVDPAKLGSGGYHDQARVSACRTGGRQWSSADLTRPFAKGNPLGGQPEGFFLNFPNTGRFGAGVSAPVYYEFKAGRSLTYRFFYAFNDAPGGGAFNHEGDWERISVELGPDNRARRVAYFQHDGYCVLPWSAVERFRGHPVVFSVVGTHASYRRAGQFPLPLGTEDRAAGGGGQWRAWDHLHDVTKEGWYGYGGAWGEVGAHANTTGPLGPSARWKPGAPKSFAGRSCA